MNMDVVTIDHKIILNPEFGDQPKMIKKKLLLGGMLHSPLWEI